MDFEWLNRWSILFHRVRIDDFPQLLDVPMVRDQPGDVLFERTTLQCLRWGSWGGLAGGLGQWWWRRSRMPLGQRVGFSWQVVAIPVVGHCAWASFALGTVATVYEARCKYPAYHRPGASDEERAVDVSHMVNDVLLLRRDPTYMQWMMSAGRFVSIFSLAFVVTVHTGSLASRVGQGIGVGMLVSSMISALDIDKTIALTAEHPDTVAERQREQQRHAALLRSSSPSS